MSLTYPQTPINKSLSKAFQHTHTHSKTPWERSWDTQQEIHATSSIKEYSEVQKLCQNQALKPLRTSRTSISNTKKIRSKIIQTTCLDLKGHQNQAQKPPKFSRNCKLVKLYGFKPLKPQRTSTTNLRIRITFKEKSSKSSSQNSKFTRIKLKSLQKPQQTTNQ